MRDLWPWPRIDYHAMRMAHARALLLALLQRWGAYGLVGGMVLGAGSNSPLGSAQSAVVAMVLPMRQAADHGLLWLAVPAYALAALLPVVLTRRLWWPPRWAAAEAALPLPAAELARSDRRLLPWLLLPLQGLMAIGIGTLVHHAPPAERLACLLAATGLLAAAALATVLTAGWMRHLRRAAGVGATGRAGDAILAAAGTPPGAHAAPTPTPTPTLTPTQTHTPTPTPSSTLAPQQALHRLPSAPTAAGAQALPHHAPPWPLQTVRPLGWAAPLLWWPLWRGPARRSGRALVLGLMVCPAPALAMAPWPQATGWWLAGLACAALVATAMLRQRLAQDMAAWQPALRALPLAASRLSRGRTALALLPALGGLLAAGFTLPWHQARPLVATAYALALALALALACWRDALAPADGEAPPADQASRWLFSLALTVALGTEVLR